LKENCGGDPHSASFSLIRLENVRRDTYRGERDREKNSYREVSQVTTESLIT